MKNTINDERIDLVKTRFHFDGEPELAEKERRIEIYEQRRKAGLALFEDKNGKKTY